MARAEPQRRADYPHLLAITTRWMDNDAYGHINNVTYYSYFDTVANHYLIHEGGLDILASPVIGLVVELSPLVIPGDFKYAAALLILILLLLVRPQGLLGRAQRVG